MEFPIEALLRSVPWSGGKALMLVVRRSRRQAGQLSHGAAGGSQPLIAELEARIAEMRTIIDTATDGVVLIGRDGTIRSISRPAEALFGFDSDDVDRQAVRLAVCHRKPARGARLSQRPVRPWRRQRAQ